MYTFVMAEQEIQQFYNDRRQRGLSDKIIFNELEGAGWPKEGLQERIAAARTAYERLSNADFMSDGAAVEYSIPQLPRKKGFIRAIVSLGIFLVYVFYTYQEVRNWIVFSVTIIIFSVVTAVAFVPYWVKARMQPRRIRFDSQGITILEPLGRLHPWSTLMGYWAGQKQLTADEEPDKPLSAPIFSLWKQKPTTRPVIRFYKNQIWMGVKSKELMYTLPLPPGREAEIVNFIRQYTPELIGTSAPASYGFTWKLFIVGLVIVFLFLIWAIIIMLK